MVRRNILYAEGYAGARIGGPHRPLETSELEQIDQFFLELGLCGVQKMTLTVADAIGELSHIHD